MKIFKKIICLIILCSQLLQIEISANEVKILLKVKNEIITNIDIQNEMQYLSALNNEVLTLDENTFYKLAKDSVIKERIKKNELVKYYDISKILEAYNDIFENFYKKMGYENENAFQNYLNNYDLKTEEIREKIKIETLWNELIYTKYASKINIDKEEIKAKIKKNSYNKKSNEYSLSEIVFNIDLANELNERYEVINKSIKNIGFKNTANIYSLSDTAKLGGEIGWINENQLTKKIIDKIKSLKIGQWSTPLKISNGFLILKVNDKKISNVNIDMGEELKKAVNYETNKQLTQYSLIYYNKIKYNQTGNEF